VISDKYHFLKKESWASEIKSLFFMLMIMYYLGVQPQTKPFIYTQWPDKQWQKLILICENGILTHKSYYPKLHPSSLLLKTPVNASFWELCRTATLTYLLSVFQN